MTTDSFQSYIASEKGRAELSKLYTENIDGQVKRYSKALSSFREYFGDQDVCVLSSPGRTELGGNHTDHQNGCVLCASIQRDILCVAGKRDDGTAVLECDGYGRVTADLRNLEPAAQEYGKTSALVRGMASLLLASGYNTGGFNAVIYSDVPVGGGFSSSAALEILIGNLLMALYEPGKHVSPVHMAQMGKQAENIWFGKPCGLMDQCACAIGGISFLDFKVPGAPEYKKLNTSFEAYGYSLGTISVGSSHADLTRDYASIPADMHAVAAFFHKTHLRYVDRHSFENSMAELRKNFSEKTINRAIHFFNENLRPEAMVNALESGNIEDYCALMLSSGISSETLLQNIIPESAPMETKLAEALRFCGAHLKGKNTAFRVHGGGFGGSVQVLMPDGLWPEFRTEAEKIFGINSCQKLLIRSAGAYIMTGENESC